VTEKTNAILCPLSPQGQTAIPLTSQHQLLEDTTLLPISQNTTPLPILQYNTPLPIPAHHQSLPLLPTQELLTNTSAPPQSVVEQKENFDSEDSNELNEDQNIIHLVNITAVQSEKDAINSSSSDSYSSQAM
jgi:hypothetical protein